MKAQEHTSDAELIQAYQAGHSRAFDRLLERYQNPLFTYLVRRVQDRMIAEDLFQETFLRVIRALPDYDERNKFNNWLFGIAHRLCIDHFRKINSSRHYFSDTMDWRQEMDHFAHADEAPSPQEILENQELNELIMRAVQEMPEPVQEVFLLRQHGELSFREIAALLERPLNTVLGQMRQAVLYLSQNVGKQYV